MAERRWMQHSIRLGLVGVQRRLRGIRRDRARVRLLGFAFACFAFVFIGMGVLFAYGLRTTSTPVAIPTSLRMGMTAAWLFAVWYFSQRVLLYYRQLDNESFVLTTVSTRTAVRSLLLTEVLSVCLVLALPTVVLVGVIGYAFSHAVSIALIPLTTVLFAASVTVVGFVIGFSYLHLTARSQVVEGHSYTIIIRIVVILGIIAVIGNGFIPNFELPTVRGFRWLPTGWLIDLAALGIPSNASAIRAGVSLIGVVVITVAGSAIVERLATTYWYGDAGTAGASEGHHPTSNDERKPIDGTDVIADALSPLFVPSAVSTPTRRIAQVTLLRLRRAPRRLSFLVGPVISLGVVLLIQAANPLRLVPIVCVIGIPWFVGASFGLNPLGNQGAVLPVMLTSVSGHQFVRGLMVPGVVYGVPLTVGCTLITGVFSPYSAVTVAGLGMIGAILTVVAVVFAPAVGMRLPRFDAVIVGERDGAVLPSLTALAIYSFLVGSLGRVATVTLLGSRAIDDLLTSQGVSLGLFHLGGTAVVVMIGIVVGYVSYRSAVARFIIYRFK